MPAQRIPNLSLAQCNETAVDAVLSVRTSMAQSTILFDFALRYDLAQDTENDVHCFAQAYRICSCAKLVQTDSIANFICVHAPSVQEAVKSFSRKLLVPTPWITKKVPSSGHACWSQLMSSRMYCKQLHAGQSRH